VRFKKESEALNFEQNIESITKNRKNMGIEEAIIQEVKEKSKLEGKIEVIETMLKNGLGIGQIAQYLNLNLDFVKQIAQKIKK
jgi:predicted transposase/invertase (TIGR01784 family)